MSTVSNGNITFGCVQFVTVKEAVFTLVSIFLAGLGIYIDYSEEVSGKIVVTFGKFNT